MGDRADSDGVLRDHQARQVGQAGRAKYAAGLWLRRCRRLGAAGWAEAGCNSYPVPGDCPLWPKFLYERRHRMSLVSRRANFTFVAGAALVTTSMTLALG